MSKRRHPRDPVSVPECPKVGWKPPPSYTLRLYRADGSIGVRKLAKGTTYAQAVMLRDEALRTGAYEKIWLLEVR